MKLLVSDYDGTIYFKDDIEYTFKNLESINNLLRTGNKFCIATGRSYKSLKEQTDHFSIKYDYLATNNGNVIFDNKDNILSVKLLDKCLVREFVCALRKISSIDSIHLLDMYGYETNNFFEVVEISVYLNKKINLQEITELKELLKHFQYRMFMYKYYFKDFITKSDAVEFISTNYLIPKSNIYTIGDDTNDIDMIRKYNGFIVPKSYIDNESLNNQTLKLHELIKEKIL